MYIAKELISGKKFNLATSAYHIAMATIHILNRNYPKARFTLIKVDPDK